MYQRSVYETTSIVCKIETKVGDLANENFERSIGDAKSLPFSEVFIHTAVVAH